MLKFKQSDTFTPCYNTTDWACEVLLVFHHIEAPSEQHKLETRTQQKHGGRTGYTDKGF